MCFSSSIFINIFFLLSYSYDEYHNDHSFMSIMFYSIVYLNGKSNDSYN